MSEDFLAINAPDTTKQQADAIAFAAKYLIFTLSDAGKDLLAHWEETYHQKRTPVNATIQEYAANEAMRSFIQGIRNQIKIAQTGRFT